MTTVAAAPVTLDASRPPQFPALDALRAVGALAVLTTHVAFWSGDYSRHGSWGTTLARLDVGVALFFVLSGFLLSRPYLARAAAGLRRPRTASYLWKRFLRIVPVYVVAVVVALTFIEDNADLDVLDWLTSLLLLDTFVTALPPAGLSHMWSLAVEVTFYLVLPALMLLATGRRTWRPARVWSVLAVMVVVSVWWHLDGTAWAQGWSAGAPAQWLPGYLTWFAAGIGIALLHVVAEQGDTVAARVLSLGRRPGVCWSLAAGMLLIASTPLAGPALLVAPTSAESLTKNVLYAAVGALVVLAGVMAEPETSFGRFFGHPAARRLGLTSYSLFALHLPVLHLVMWLTGWQLFGGRGLQLWLLVLVVSLVVAEISYRLVEVPAMRFKRLVPDRSRDIAAATGRTASGTTGR